MRILDAIAHGISDIENMAMISATPETSFGRSLPKTLRYLQKVADQRERKQQRMEEEQRIRVTIAKLVHEGMVQKKESAGWSITKTGKKKLRSLREWIVKKKSYEMQDEKTLKIIIFDIPERYRNHRDWIRSTLYTMNYELLQQSVFAGTGKLPDAFIKDIDQRGMLHHVQIFSVGKYGTLEKHLHTYHPYMHINDHKESV